MQERERTSEEQRVNSEIKTRALIDQGVEQLLSELLQGKSERLQQYLAFTARFHHYSTYNQMLIYMQCPNATYVAGYRRWQELGYQVARKQKGIHILAPRTHKEVDPQTQEERKRLYFFTVTVFDAAQLVKVKDKPLPEFFTPLGDDQQELYNRLAEVVTEDGIVISEEQTGLAQGYSAKGRIALKEGLDSRSKVLTLIHEYAHEILHQNAEGRKQARQVKECHAEAVAYIVAHHFGIHNPFSADYLQYWGTTPRTLMAELDTVNHAAAYIISRMEKSTSEQRAVEETP